MAARELLIVALRVLGIWYLAWILPSLSWAAGALLTMSSASNAVVVQPVNPFTSAAWICLQAMTAALYLLLGAGLVFGAPRIARMFYPVGEQDDDARISFGPVTAQDVYRIAAFLLGIYVLIQGICFAMQTVVQLLQRGWQSGFGTAPYTAIRAGIYLACGTALVFGGRGLGELLGRLRPDTEDVPAQQFNLRVLFVLFLLCVLAVALVSALTR